MERRNKQSLCIAIGVVAAIGFSGCNSSTVQSTTSETQTSQMPTEKKKVILTTFTVLADMAQNVAGDKAIVESLTKQGAEIHGYEPTPSDLKKAQQAASILDNGMGLERWAQRFYSSLKTVPHVTISEGITPIPIAEGAYQNQPNPHAWMSPKNALIYVENIRQALVKLDSANETTYNANAATYSQQIREIDRKLRTALAKLPENKRFLVSCEGAFTYLIRDYQLKEIYLWPINADQQGTPQQIRQTIDKVKANRVPTVFCESTVSDKSQRQVAQEAGAKFGGVFYVDSLTGLEGKAPTYLKLLEYNVNTLINGLGGG